VALLGVRGRFPTLPDTEDSDSFEYLEGRGEDDDKRAARLADHRRMMAVKKSEMRRYRWASQLRNPTRRVGLSKLYASLWEAGLRFMPH
jgi:hypothetical protein